MLTAETVKKMAKSMGADAVAIGNIERWEGAPTQMDPRQIMPEARSVIAMGFRVMRGSLRGIEEGTFFSNYSAMGYGGITYLYMPMTVINLCKEIEDSGYEALPMGHQSDWRMIDADGFGRKNYSRPVEAGRASPDVMIQLRIASFLCGLGEIGYSKMLLTPQFGPRQRVGIIITEAELEPDPLYPDTDGPELCNRCMACVKECPTGAINGTKTIKVNLAGHDVEWGEIDCAACDIAFRGGLATDEELSEEERYTTPMFGKNVGRSPHTPFYKKPRNLYNTGQAVCGARGCTRACMISMESRGVVENTFKDKFRRRKPWTVDWSTEPEYPSDLVMKGDGPSATPEAKPAD
ncbi:MAG: 4Fe-4S binding protein [Lentisphaerae bacterium]|jgi:epoxyqueuosine reductase|nr:4Fe-4S binding protein [Lentisphaerota bacterium]MBT4817285.1 4Fe-4S binding protein [Lentisphaerota bacterium]MBT5607718.1 4Fe-4S binding protein [Lentisphaerota bacterium]MBT7054881.1 4Fe-4S binding protein [Lentisphaerota bacterium]MBT7843349.1 4Fe-4S binding protein [Lentisphaerota bacterium]